MDRKPRFNAIGIAIVWGIFMGLTVAAAFIWR